MRLMSLSWNTASDPSRSKCTSSSTPKPCATARENALSQPSSEQALLLAEYALDFALQAASRALLISLEAIDAQMTEQEEARNAQ